MEVELGKLFIGGISWDTNEDRLREYFQTFGEVVEAVIMKDRATGRARGFGFVVFADPATAEKVVMEKHIIDGRTVEAKKAVPRDDQNTLNRNNSSSIHGSPGPTRTKKIFVGGLASTVTESGFKKYFDQFGTITDVVVMYDHNTQRPRGFGFITYDSEEAVEKVLHKTFHELNGKMVEVKRAVPKELSPSPARVQVSGYNPGMGRVSSFLNGYTQGYNPNSVAGFGVRMDGGRYSPVNVGRNGFSPFGPNFSMGVNFEPGMSPSYGGNGNFNPNPNLGYGREPTPLYNGSANKFGVPIGYNVSNGGNGSLLSSPSRNMWGNGNLGYAPNPSALMGSGNGNSGAGSFGNIGAIWGSSPSSDQNGRVGSPYNSIGNNLGLGSRDANPGLAIGGYGRSVGVSIGTNTNDFPNAGYDGADMDLFDSASVYDDLTWRSSPSALDRSNSFGYGAGNAASDAIMSKNPVGYVGGYSRQANRGIAA